MEKHQEVSSMRRICKFVVLFMFGVIALAFGAGNTLAYAETIVPVEGDTFVQSDFPATNFGTDDPLEVGGQVIGSTNEPERTALLYFPDTPSGVTSAKLQLYSQRQTHQPLSIRQISCAGWTESTVTYNSFQEVQKGTVIATIPDDPAGPLEVTIPVTAINAGFGGTSENANCFAVEKTGDLKTWLSSREGPAGQAAQLVVETDSAPTPVPTPMPTPAPSPIPDPFPNPNPTSPVAKCGGTPVTATPSTMSSILNSSNSVTINAQPGVYSYLRVHKTTADSCVEIHCTVSAKIGESPNPNGCRISGQSIFESIKNLTVEGFVITTSEDYGYQLYDESPYVCAYTRIANNVFAGSNNHDIATKNRNCYTEVVDNIFANCRRHCWEIGQNGNIPSRPSTTGIAIFRGNIARSKINVLTQRYNKTLIVENNDFRGTDEGYIVNNWPFWARYPDPSTGEFNRIPEGPLRTSITNNKFAGYSRLLFTSRGSLDDVILIKGNTGTVTSCLRAPMDYQKSGTSVAHSNEQTTAPPMLDLASDTSCPTT
jgi:hypothetical protein